MILVMLSAPPGTLRAREQLDLALGCLACDLSLRVLFSGTAVRLLARERVAVDDDPSPLPRAYRALAAYGCERIGVCQHSLADYGLKLADCILEPEALTAAEQREWLHAASEVLGD